MRYEPAMRLLRLTTLLAGSRVGLSLDEMMAELEVSRRTAERLRDHVAEVFPALTHRDGEDRVRRWRLPNGVLPPTAPSVSVLASLEGVARDLTKTGDTARGADLREAAATLRALLPPVALRRTEPDIEALMQAEGSAAHPGPRLKLDRALMTDIRSAILGFRKLALTYRPAESNHAGKRILCPYGVLYGRRAYLVAHTEKGAEMRLWRIDRLSDVSVLGENFAAQEFDLAGYAEQSFGVFQEAPQDVVLRFSPEAAEDAAEWVFHPSQTMEQQADGSLMVRFTCGGMLELSWHLFTWGREVEVKEPWNEVLLDHFRRTTS
jgi:predicted DNA-binding transcriptional regulator YafY